MPYPSPCPTASRPCWSSVFPFPKALRVFPSSGSPRQGGWRWEGHLPVPEQGWSKVFARHLWLQGSALAGMPCSSPVSCLGPRDPMLLARSFLSSSAVAEAILEGEAPCRDSQGHIVTPPPGWYPHRDEGKRQPTLTDIQKYLGCGDPPVLLFLLLFPLSQLHGPPHLALQVHITFWYHSTNLGRKARARGHLRVTGVVSHTHTPQLTQLSAP